MQRLLADNGKVAHISASIADTADGRVVTTGCGKEFAESRLTVAADDVDHCAACDKKAGVAVEGKSSSNEEDE